jgi:hypothetical protein
VRCSTVSVSASRFSREQAATLRVCIAGAFALAPRAASIDERKPLGAAR